MQQTLNDVTVELFYSQHFSLQAIVSLKVRAVDEA